ncbi:hypothetical protein CDD81_843 [Ophiocordyceps australis]|uniref:Uncharacterized protein n=1 Tax=Ophiocordyceps australis TaxID=1399860 RepID=A0A2C5Y2B6_9HYPO|nr:hypothetical protein CDD81_843 [Ophiocordyceps australis]
MKMTKDEEHCLVHLPCHDIWARSFARETNAEFTWQTLDIAEPCRSLSVLLVYGTGGSLRLPSHVGLCSLGGTLIRPTTPS